MFKKIFLKAGLTPTQADILEYLYTKKEEKAGILATKLKKSRAIIYKDLEELANFSLIEKDITPNNITIFKIGHPTQIEKFFDQKENQIKKDRQLFNNYLPDMISAYNLLSNKPGVKIYEGEIGIIKLTEDSLNAKDEILSYLDTESMMKNIEVLTEQFTKKRLNNKIVKKIIAADNNYSREYMKNNNEIEFSDKDLTKVKLLDGKSCSFNTIMNIYNNKVTYINYTGDNYTSVIIEDKNITQLHKEIFHFNWSRAKTLKQLLENSDTN